MSWRSMTLCSENDAVGPCGRCETVNAVGVPRCSCRMTMSDRPDEFADDTNIGRTAFPRFSRIAVGSSRRISLAKDDSRAEGSLDVLTNTRGSTTPLRCAYSSSSSSSSSAVRSALDSSNRKSRRKALSLAISGANGLPLARDALSFARFCAVSASFNVRARRNR